MSGCFVAVVLLAVGSLAATGCGSGDDSVPAESPTASSIASTSASPRPTEPTATPTATIPSTTATPPPTSPPGSCTTAAFEAGLPYPGITDPSMIVRFACAGDYATLLAKPPTDAPSFVLVLTWTGTDWVADRECHNDVIGVAACLADLDPTLVDELALVGETYPRDVSEIDPSTWAQECSTPSLKRRDTGVCVARLQTLLAITGADLDVDGSLGPETEARLLAFQNATQLEADGLAGTVTWAALVDAVAHPPTTVAAAPFADDMKPAIP